MTCPRSRPRAGRAAATPPSAAGGPDGAARRGPRRRHQRGARVARRPGRRMLIRNARVWPSGARLAAEAALADLPRDRRAPGRRPGHRMRAGPAAGARRRRTSTRPAGPCCPACTTTTCTCARSPPRAASVAPGRRDVRTAGRPGGAAARRGRGPAAGRLAARRRLPRVGRRGPGPPGSRPASPPTARCGCSTAPARCGWSTRRRRPAGPGRVRAQRGGTRRRRPADRAAVADGPLARGPGARPRPADLAAVSSEGGSARDHGLHRRHARRDRRATWRRWPKRRWRSACTAWRPPGVGPPPASDHHSGR